MSEDAVDRSFHTTESIVSKADLAASGGDYDDLSRRVSGRARQSSIALSITKRNKTAGAREDLCGGTILSFLEKGIDKGILRTVLRRLC